MQRCKRVSTVLETTLTLSLQIEAESELEILAMLAEGEETLAPPISTGYAAMLGAKALFLERLSQGVLKAPAIHRQQPTWPRSLAIHDHWQTRVDAGLKPGSEAALLTEIATLAGFIFDSAPRVQGRLF